MMRGIAATTAIYKNYTLNEALQGIAKAGYRYVELAAMPGWCEHITPAMDAAERSEVKRQLAALALTPVAVAAHCNFIEAEARKVLMNTMKLAREMGCDIVVTSPGVAPENSPERAGALKELDTLCTELGLVLALEPHGELGSAQKLAALIKSLDTKHIKINFDTANVLFFASVQPLNDLDSAFSELAYVHFKDKIGPQGEWNFPAVGKGELPFAAILKKLKNAGYGGFASVEIEYTPDAQLSLEALNADVTYSLQQLNALMQTTG